MFAFYRSSVYSVVTNAGRRTFHSTWQSLKSTPGVESTKKAGTETIANVSTEASASSGGIMSFAKENPFVFQLGVATAKTSAADLVAQVVGEKKSFEEVDWKRNAIFVVFGFAYLGGFQYWLMVNKYRQWFPTMDRFAKLPFAEKLKDTAGIIDAGKMVMFDIIVHLPVMYFPTYYAVKEFVGGQSWNPADWVMDGVTKYAKNSKEDLTAMVKLWLPSDCVQFVLPMHIRLPFRHIVSFFWTAYVSFTRGAIEPNKKEE
jgi:Mpv17 / PMP22 family